MKLIWVSRSLAEYSTIHLFFLIALVLVRTVTPPGPIGCLPDCDYGFCRLLSLACHVPLRAIITGALQALAKLDF